MWKEWGKRIGIFLIVAIVLEVAVFNFRAWASLGASNQELVYSVNGNIVTVSGMEGKPGYVYVGADIQDELGNHHLLKITPVIQDEGNVKHYELPEKTIYTAVEKSKYLPIQSYGDITDMYFILEAANMEALEVKEIIYDARVPFFVSVLRIIILVFGMLAVYGLRPSSGIYEWAWSRKQKIVVCSAIIGLNVAFFFLVVRSNPAFFEPLWPYHQQYHQLAVAMSEGNVFIDVGTDAMREALAGLENPYDFGLRNANVPGVEEVWDTCYYKGQFYVYFGVVPVLLLYLPFYLITGGAFPTWFGVFLASAGVLSGVFFLMAQIVKRWFPNTSYTLYLLLSVIFGNSLNLYPALMHADFYCLPIILALCFSVWGMGLMLSALNQWEKKSRWKLALGALFMALTAGCRPQFLVGSFLLIPMFLPAFKEKTVKVKWSHIVAVVVPYVLVAAGLMYYNYIRFESVFDFGANYNLTTNDMTRRGLNLQRLPDGIFMYLFQPISVKLIFPFAEVTSFVSTYMGETIRDWTFGGALWTHMVILSLFAVGVVKKELKDKKLWGLTVLSMCLAILVVIADTEMAGILNRYYTDFLWLFMIPVMLILLQLFQKYKGTAVMKGLIVFVLIAGACGIFYELAIALRGSGIMNDNIHRFYMLKSMFE